MMFGEMLCEKQFLKCSRWRQNKRHWKYDKESRFLLRGILVIFLYLPIDFEILWKEEEYEAILKLIYRI